jgi:hypothetical protein
LADDPPPCRDQHEESRYDSETLLQKLLVDHPDLLAGAGMRRYYTQAETARAVEAEHGKDAVKS